jgi:hypothetical protein
MTSTASSSSSSSTAFSFLYLDDHEDVVSVVQNCRLQCLHRRDCYEKKTKGSVWITTHALFFEPSSEEEEEDGATRFLVLGDGDAFSAGEGKKLMKIKYEDAIGPSIELSRIERNAVDISSEKVVLIAENEPREIVRDATVVWRISMDGEGEDDVAVEQRLRTPVNKLLNISKQKNRQTKCEQLAFLSRQREGNLRFDEKNLKLDGERSRFEAPAAKISPLVRRAGRVRVTDAHLYFQPLIVRDSKAKKNVANWVALKDIVAVARRRYASRPVAVEVFYEVNTVGNGNSKSTMMRGSSVLFAFRSESAREAAIEALLKNDNDESENETKTLSSFLDPTNVEAISKVTNAWKIGDVSNFEYLMYLNALSGRSFHDVAQYFVFPWVLNDYGGVMSEHVNAFDSDNNSSSNGANIDVSDASMYRDLSKPIGALNPERLKYFQERMKHMQDVQKQQRQSQKPFLYGTHYSAPGYVLFYLLRCAPKHNLKLQNGSFDKPDRLFKSITETWSSCLHNNADLKELIPEFFVPECSRKFLRNNLKLNLGHRASAPHSKIDDVILPQWAKNDPVRFTTVNRKALESETASSRLNEWIDLIFGVYQNDCKNKMNSFHPLTYEGEINVDDAASIDEQMSLETQINEFGQTPKRIFEKVHEKRRREAWKRWKGDCSLGVKRKTSRKSQSMNSLGYENLGTPPSTTTEINDEDVEDDDETITPIPLDIRASVIDTVRLVSRRADDYLFVGDEDEEDAAVSGIEALKLNDSPLRRAASPSNNMLERSFSDAHENNASLDKEIECVVLGDFRAPSPSNDDDNNGSRVLKKWSRRTHNGAVTAVECFADSNVAYSTGTDGFVRIVDLKNGDTIRAVPASSSAITSLAVMRQNSDPRRLPIALYSTSNGNMFAYNGEYGSVDRVSSTNLTPISAIKVPAMSSERNRAVTSHANGAVALRDIENRVEVSVFGTNEFSGDGANDVLVDPQCHILVSAHDSGVVKAFDTRSSALKPVWKQSVASRRNIAARSIAFAPLGDGLGDALGFIVAVDDSGQCCALETRMRGRIVAAAETTTTSRFANALLSANSALRVNVDSEKNIVVSGFANNVFRVGKEAGVLRDENDFQDLMFQDNDDCENFLSSTQSFTAACFKTGSSRSVFVGAANGELASYSH